MDPLGKAMFGRPLRLRVLWWVEEQNEVFHQSEAAKGVQYSSVSAVAKELVTLEGMGMLRRFGRPVGNERQNYRRLESPLWEIVRSVKRVLLVEPEAEAADQ